MATRMEFWVQYIGAMWHVRQNKVTLSRHELKARAVDAGVKAASSNAPSELFICREDGTIEDRRTYGSDPFPPRG